MGNLQVGHFLFWPPQGHIWATAEKRVVFYFVKACTMQRAVEVRRAALSEIIL